jgi:hypothetical protein
MPQGELTDVRFVRGARGFLPPWFLLPWTCPAGPSGDLPPEAVILMILGFLGMIVF